MGRILLATSAFAALFGTAAYAQEQQDTTVLERLLVTEGRTPVAQEESGRAFTVITGEQLEQHRINNVSDALRLVPGFSVSRSGGPTQVRVRGMEANHLLVMIDGIEVSETSTGEFDFSSLVADNIDRIEVLRGPQSAFWGSNAVAGVVNIITKRGSRDGFSMSARTEVGSEPSYLGGISLGGGRENFDVALSGVLRSSNGFNLSRFGDEDDGDRNGTFHGKFTVDLTPNLTLDGVLRFVDRKTDVDPQDYTFGSPTYGLVIDGDDWTKTRELFGAIGATHVSLDGALTQKFRFTGADMYRENWSAGTLAWNDGNRYNGSYQASYAFDTPGFAEASHQLTAGYEWEQETFLPSHLQETFERTTNSFVGEYRGAFFDQLFVNAALRHDLNDRFAEATTYSLSAAWQIPNSATRLHASVGTGVTAPTFFQQFGYVPSSFVGNPDLQPEESLGWDIGVEQRFFDGRLVADVTYFNQDLTNEIEVIFGGPPDFVSTPVNLEGESRRQGVELSATLDLLNGFTATATYTYTDATEQTASDGERTVEIRRPKHAGSLTAAYSFLEDRARVFGEVVVNGRMDDFSYVTGLPTRVSLDSYTVVNLGGSYRINEHLEAYARVENLFDEDYEEVFSYKAPGRAAFVGLKGNF